MPRKRGTAQIENMVSVAILCKLYYLRVLRSEPPPR